MDGCAQVCTRVAQVCTEVCKGAMNFGEGARAAVALIGAGNCAAARNVRAEVRHVGKGLTTVRRKHWKYFGGSAVKHAYDFSKHTCPSTFLKHT